MTLQPIIFTAMFTYIFGGAISGDVRSYLPMIIPGILAQTVITTSIATGMQLREDMEKGVFDRFKSLPIARIAPLAGAMLADLVRYVIAATSRSSWASSWATGPAAVCSACSAAIAARDLLRLGDRWIFAWVGMIARSARACRASR